MRAAEGKRGSPLLASIHVGFGTDQGCRVLGARRWARASRFAAGRGVRGPSAVLAQYRCVIAADDDLIADEATIDRLIDSHAQDPDRAYTLHGRCPTAANEYAFHVEHVSEPTEAVMHLTRLPCLGRQHVPYYFIALEELGLRIDPATPAADASALTPCPQKCSAGGDSMAKSRAGINEGARVTSPRREIGQNRPKTGPYDSSPVPLKAGKPRTRAEFRRLLRRLP